MLASAEGGVLYIDEAYSLFDDYESDFGRLAVAQIVKRMEDNRHDLVIVMADYPKEMKKLIEMNSGLISRFNFVLDFPDYSTPELLKIAHEMLKKNILTPCSDFDGVFSEIIEAGRTKDGQKFGNGRFVRNMMHAVSRELSQRLEKEGRLDQPYTADELRALRTITPDDLWVVAATKCQMPKPKHTALKPASKRVVQLEKAEA